MKKSKKGFSLVALMATVAIMIVLITTVVISGINTSNNAKKMAFGTEISLIETSVNAYSDKNNGMYPIGDSIELDVSSLTTEAKEQFIDNGEIITNDKINLYEIDYEKIEISTLKLGNKKEGDNDIYVVSEKTGKVYYAKGYKVGGYIFFCKTEEIENLISYDMDKNLKLSKTPVLFEPSNTKWTNKDVTVIVKIPKSLTIVDVVANGTSVPPTTGDLDYNKYLATVTQNGEISVNYKENSTDTQTLEAKYEIKNIDKVVPSVTVNNTLESAYNNEENILGYLKILSKSDALSGIKNIKFDTESVTNNIFDYFQQNGTKLESDTIVVNKGVFNVTVYVEDNAGNFASVVIPIST